jgi:simple sugar transport system ATP-binding protein
VLENIIIGSESAKGMILDLRAARKKLQSLQDRFGLRVDPDPKVWTLSIGEQQRVEILKALFRDVDILIMDEPTAVLAPTEISDLFQTLRSLTGEGKSIVFISHKLNEVMAISDRIVVLRTGRVVAEKRTKDTNTRELANLMVGRDLLERIARKKILPGEPVLEISGLTVLNDRGLEAVKSLGLTVRKREILGIAGVSGNGQRELAEVLFGVRLPQKGKVMVCGRGLRFGHPSQAIKLGMARIPEDRIETGLLMDVSVEENLILENHTSPEFQKRGLMNFTKISQFSGQHSGFRPGRNRQKPVGRKPAEGNPRP